MPKDSASHPSLSGIQLAQAGPGALGEPIGAVETLAGKSFITRVDGTKVQAIKGMPVYQGDQVETGGIAHLGITFADDTTFALGSNGQMTLDEMVYDSGSQSGNLAIDVAEGVFSFVSGQIAKTSADAMTITTPATTIGVRGSSGVGSGGPRGAFGLLRDPTGDHGELTIGTRVDFETLNEPFAATHVDGPFNPPTLSTVLPPSIMQQTFGSISGAVPGAKPSFTPLAGRAGNVAQNQAALNTFNSTLAAGSSIGDALSRATTNASDVRQVQKWDAIGSGPYAPEDISQQVTDNILNAKSNDAQGGIGATGKDPLSAGDGEEDSFGVKGAEVKDAKAATDETKAEVEEDTDNLNKDTEDTTKQQAPQDLGAQANSAFNQVTSQIQIGISQINKGGEIGLDPGELINVFINEIAGEIEHALSTQFAEAAGGEFFNDAFSQDFFDEGHIDPFAFSFGKDIATGTESFFDVVLQDEFFDFGPGFGGFEGEDAFFFDPGFADDDDDDDSGSQVPVTSFDQVFTMTTAGESLDGSSNVNTMFFFPAAAFASGADAIDGGLGSINQMSFDGLDNVYLKLEMDNAVSFKGTVTHNTNKDGTSGTDSTITFDNIQQILLADTTVPGLAEGTISGAQEAQSGGGSEAPTENNIGDVRVFPSLGTGETGFAIAGTSSGETFNINSGGGFTNNHALVFGKGGGDTFNISVLGSRILIGGITATDNVDSNSDLVPDQYVNDFSYSGLDQTGTQGLNINLFGEPDHPGADAGVQDIAGNHDVDDILWDVGAITGSVDNDQIFAGNFITLSTVAGGGGTDTLNFTRLSNGITMNSSMKVTADINGDTTTDTVIGTVLTDIEVIKGTGFSDTLYAHSSGTKLYGMGSGDTLFGAGGDDEFLFGRPEQGGIPGTTSGYDTISSFSAFNGTTGDKVTFTDDSEVSGTFKTDLDDTTVNGSLNWATNGQASFNFASTAEAWFIDAQSGAANIASLTFSALTSSLSTVAAALNALASHTVSSAAGDDALIVITPYDATTADASVIYHFQENGNALNSINQGDLAIMATVDDGADGLTSTDVVTNNAVGIG